MEYKKLAESMSDSAKIARYFGERILLTSGSEAIKNLLSNVEELEAQNRRLEEARENANACAKWEGLYRAELEKKSAWVSVKDRLPELPDFDHCDRMVITCDWKGHVAPMYWERITIRGKSIERWRYHFDRIYDGFGITHWMPLPEAPKEEYYE